MKHTNLTQKMFKQIACAQSCTHNHPCVGTVLSDHAVHKCQYGHMWFSDGEELLPR